MFQCFRTFPCFRTFSVLEFLNNNFSVLELLNNDFSVLECFSVLERFSPYRQFSCFSVLDLARNLLTTEATNITKGFHMLLKVNDKLWLFPLKNTHDSYSVQRV